MDFLGATFRALPLDVVTISIHVPINVFGFKLSPTVVAIHLTVSSCHPKNHLIE